MSARGGALEALDTTSFLNDGRWTGSLFIGAGELSGSMVLRSAQRRSVVTAERCQVREGAARAARKTRLFVVANDLRSSLTLTFGSALRPMQAAHEVKLLMRRCGHHRERFPYLWVLERGERRGRVHCHLLLPASMGHIAAAMWNHGTVDVVVKPPNFEALRRSAAYVAKAFDSPVLDGQRYKVPKGFQPEAIPITAANAELLVQEAEARMGVPALFDRRSGLTVSAQWES